MTAISIPRKNLAQPQGFTRASGDGLIAAFSGADLTFDAVSQQSGAIVAGGAGVIELAPTPNGLATEFTPTAIGAVMLPRPIVFDGSYSWSIFVRFRCDSAATNGMLLGQYNTVTSWFRVDRGGNRFIYTPQSGAGSTGLSGAINGNWHDLTISWEFGGTLRIFYDGGLRNTVTGISGSFVFDSFGYAYNSLQFMFDGGVEGCLVRDRASSLDEHIADGGAGMYRVFRADPIRIYSLPSGPITLGTPRFLRVTSSGFGVELDLS